MELRKIFRVGALLTIVMFALTACGGGGGGDNTAGGNGNPPPSGSGAPTNLSYSPQTWAIGEAITPYTPTVTGTVTSYSITPNLPEGVSFNTTTGTLLGTPVYVQTAKSYTVTATNSSGSTTATLAITITLPKPSIVYNPGAITLTVGAPVWPLITASEGTYVGDLTVSPPLPPGLAMVNGAITGTPTVASPETTYTISTTNSGGTASFGLKLTVRPKSTPTTLLELGHQGSVSTVRLSATRLLTADSNSHWVLWSYPAGTRIAQGDAGCISLAPPNCQGPGGADLAGTTVVIETADGFEIRAASDGHLVTRVAAPHTRWSLAVDGSYVVTSDNTSISIWSTTDGSRLFTQTGNIYQYAIHYAAAGEVRTGFRYSNSSFIEKISVPGGVVTRPAIAGEFESWFADGQHFFTRQSTTFRVYDLNLTQADIFTQANVSTLDGSDNWYWMTYSGLPFGEIKFFAIGSQALGAPALTTTHAGFRRVSDSKLVFLEDTAADYIDLAQGALTITARAAPLSTKLGYAELGAQWAVGTDKGIVADGTTLATTPHLLSLGAVTAITGGTQYFAVALASGEIRYYDSATLAQAGTLPVAINVSYGDRVLESSSDGTTLGLYDPTVPDLKIYSLPSNGVLYTYPGYLRDFEIAGPGAGTVLARGRSVTSLSGTPIWSDSPPPPPFGSPPNSFPTLRLSPDGTLIAASGYRAANEVTNLVRNGALFQAVTGWAAGWIDNDRLLVNGYRRSGSGSSNFYTTASILDATGATLVSGLRLPEIQQFQTASPTSIYMPERNQIFSLTNGGTLWNSGEYGQSGIGSILPGNKVVFAAGGRVLVDTY